MLMSDRITINCDLTREAFERLLTRGCEMHRISALADLPAKALPEKLGDIGFIIDDQDACATRRLPSGQADAHAAAPVLGAWEFRGSRMVNSVNSPTRLSTSIVPPCCWGTMS